jgi:hypothetical protein
MLAMLAVVTTGLINEIAHALPWPYPVRTGLAVLAMVVAIIGHLADRGCAGCRAR